jgi:hypothetical protein
MQAETLERPTKCDIYSEVTDKSVAQIEAGTHRAADRTVLSLFLARGSYSV